MSGKPHIFPVERNDDKEKTTISGTRDSQSQTSAEEKERENLEERERENLEDEADHREQPETESDKPTVSHRGSDAVDDDDDGFKTPTSSDHRIPPITQCPPAPMKPRPPPPRLKRKASSPQRSSQPAEIESIFRSIAHDQDDAQQHKIKKARTDDQDRP